MGSLRGDGGRKPASDAEWDPFCKIEHPAMGVTAQFACWGQAPKPPLNSPVPGLAARFCETLLSGLRPSQGRRKRSTLFLMPGGLRLFLLPVIAHDPVHVGPDSQQLPHFVTRFFVVGVGRFFLRQQSGVLGLEALNGRQLFQPQAVKEIFRRLMQQDVALMLGLE